MFEKAKAIWFNSTPQADEYAVFSDSFEYSSGKAELKIAAGSDYNVYVNGKLAAFGQYPDYPHHKFYDSISLEDFARVGENRIEVQVWYYGIDSQTYVKSDAYAIFELSVDGNVVLFSSERTVSRAHGKYVPHICRNITYQLGLAWRYDANGKDTEFASSHELVDFNSDFELRPIKKCRLCELVTGKLIEKGKYKAPTNESVSSHYMQNAEFVDSDGDGCYYIFDLGKELVGFPEFSFYSEEEYEILIGWGEHLDDGRCRTAVRDFCLEYRAKKGENEFLGSFRRLGGRYIQLFIKGGDIEELKLGLRPVNYTVKKQQTDLTGLRKKIYDTAVHTLECCMHDHYEDCPWREQALYTFDSRNQMLCGYYAFREYDFARASLKLMSYGVREDGLMPLCFPAGVDFPIPSYSLAYFIQVEEYLRYSKDTDTVKELLPTLENIMGKFTQKIDSDGLIDGFAGFWNFYEWSETMSGNMKDNGKAKEAPLNAFLVLALKSYIEIRKALGVPYTEQETLCQSINKALGKRFYNQESKLFESYSDRHHGVYSVLTNSLCLLCGAADTYDKQNILKILVSNGNADLSFKIVPNTLSMNSFRFDALLREDAEKYSQTILDEIDRVYGYMLERGATTFWETIKGADDFKGAGSLCHGWSALPIYYYSMLAK